MMICEVVEIDYFQKQIGNIFMAQIGMEQVELRLIRIKEEVRGPRSTRTPFTLTFANPRDDERLERGRYDLVSEEGRKFQEVNLAPQAVRGQIQTYVAFFR
ncbi:DUF6916 family protein [Skermanella stibiiresistens]|nr:hypothetical protein [Skermanella stibiiresistens]